MSSAAIASAAGNLTPAAPFLLRYPALMNKLIFVLLALACSAFAQAPDTRFPEEKHLRNVRQLTFGGENAEAYFSADGKQLIFQSQRESLKCDQIFIMNVDGSGAHLVSTGKGRTTCSYFFPDGKRILFSSTHAGAPECP